MSFLFSFIFFFFSIVKVSFKYEITSLNRKMDYPTCHIIENPIVNVGIGIYRNNFRNNPGTIMSYVTISRTMISFIAQDTGVAWYMLPQWAVDLVARVHLVLGVLQWLASVAKLLHLEWASSCCSYIELVVHNIDHSIEQVAKIVPASVDSPVDTSNSSVDHNHTGIVPLPLSPVRQYLHLHNVVLYIGQMIQICIDFNLIFIDILI